MVDPAHPLLTSFPISPASRIFKVRILLLELTFFLLLIVLIPWQFHLSVVTLLLFHLWMCSLYFYNTVSEVVVDRTQDRNVLLFHIGPHMEIIVPFDRIRSISFVSSCSLCCSSSSSTTLSSLFTYSLTRGFLTTPSGIRITTDMNWSPFWPSASSAGGGEKLFWPDLSLNFSPLHGPSRFIEFNRDVVEAVNIARTTGNPFFLESVGVSEGPPIASLRCSVASRRAQDRHELHQ